MNILENMKIKLFALLLAVAASIGISWAETALIIQPLTGNEQANALAQIGYVKVTPDSLFVFSHGD